MKRPLASDTGPLLVVPRWLLGRPAIGARELQVYRDEPEALRVLTRLAGDVVTRSSM